jgi:membrane-bound inhibitor of C-type lysozyme
LKRLIVILGLGFLSLTLMPAWGQSEEPATASKQGAAAAPAAPSRQLTFQCECGKNFTAEFQDGGKSVLVNLDACAYKLPQVLSGSGARYSDGHLTVWFKGNGAFVEKEGKIILRNCTLQK